MSPSRLARFYFHECERYLRYAAATKEQRQLDGIPPIELDRTLVTQAVLQSGSDWEERVLDEYLGDRAIVADGEPNQPRPDRRHSVEQALELLARAKQGDAIYQPTLRAPASFYAEYGLDPDLVQLVDCHPDLLMVDETDDGVEVRVVDAKATDEMALSHRIQSTIYTLLLRHVLAETDHDEGLTSSRFGGVWLYGQDQPEWFELARIAPQLETFLTHELTPLLETPSADAFWHLGFRCEWWTTTPTAGTRPSAPTTSPSCPTSPPSASGTCARSRASRPSPTCARSCNDRTATTCSPARRRSTVVPTGSNCSPTRWPTVGSGRPARHRSACRSESRSAWC